MKEEYVNPFLAPAQHVWEQELKSKLEVVSAELVAHQFTTEDVTALIGITGQIQGNVLYGFSQETANAAVEIMLGPGNNQDPEIGLSALGEIANMISGNAATALAANGYPCNISPPVVIEPVGSRISTLGRPQILVTFKSDVGPLCIRISLSEVRD